MACDTVIGILAYCLLSCNFGVCKIVMVNIVVVQNDEHLHDLGLFNCHNVSYICAKYSVFPMLI